MNSRIYDILSLLGAVLIVVIIAFVMKPGMFYGTSEEQAGVTSAQTPQYADYSESVAADLLSGSYDTVTPTRDEDMWVLASRISGAMDYYEPATRDFAARYISEENSGEFSIAQVCDIWDNSVNDWTYEYQKYGIWEVSPASESINKGLVGDSNDFAVFIASLIKSVGGQARIKLAQSPQSGEHTYAEFYIGNSEDFNTPMINSAALSALKSRYPYVFSKDPNGLNVFKYESGIICPGGSGGSNISLSNQAAVNTTSKADVGELYGNFMDILFGEDESFYQNYSEDLSGIDSSDSCWYYTRPFEKILYKPEKYGSLCYHYPKLIDFLLLSPDTGVVEFNLMYIQMRYGGYNAYSPEVLTLRDIPYTYDIESDGSRSYWLKLELNGNYPGDSIYTDSRYSTIFYSDSSWKDITSMAVYG